MSEIQQPLKDVEGKVAFVTGGSSGIGLGIARAFVNAGMRVAITYRTKAHLEQALDCFENNRDRVYALDVDVTDRAGMARAAEETIRVFGKVHVLVNNAAVGLITPLGSATYNDWDWARSVNIDGVFNGIREFLPRIRAHGEGGHIVSTSSMGGLVVAKGGVYSATKFAVVGMMEALRTELLDQNIGVSVYCPGGVNSNIRESDRNRPAHLSDAGCTPTQVDLALLKAKRENNHDPDGSGPGMDPLEAGERVLRGIRNNDLYILSHPEFEQAIRDRAEALLASVPFGEPPVPKVRLNEEKDILRPQMYVLERDRKLEERKRVQP